MAVLKLSGITTTTPNPATTDYAVSVLSGSTDMLVTYSQVATTISPIITLVSSQIPTININASGITTGTVSTAVLPIATTSALGVVKPDGTTITITASGIITSTASGGSGGGITGLVINTTAVANAQGYLLTSSAGVLKETNNPAFNNISFNNINGNAYLNGSGNAGLYTPVGGAVGLGQNVSGYGAIISGSYNNDTVISPVRDDSNYLGNVVTYAGATAGLTVVSAVDADVVVGHRSITTSAVDGFLYITTCAGTPTGTPTTFSGRVPLIYDTTNDQFWIYSGGAWKQPKTPAGAAIVNWQ